MTEQRIHDVPTRIAELAARRQRLEVARRQIEGPPPIPDMPVDTPEDPSIFAAQLQGVHRRLTMDAKSSRVFEGVRTDRPTSEIRQQIYALISLFQQEGISLSQPVSELQRHVDRLWQTNERTPSSDTLVRIGTRGELLETLEHLQARLLEEDAARQNSQRPKLMVSALAKAPLPELMDDAGLMLRLNERIGHGGQPLYKTGTFYAELMTEADLSGPSILDKNTFHNVAWDMAQAIGDRYGYAQTRVAQRVRAARIIERAALVARDRLVEEVRTEQPSETTMVLSTGRTVTARRLENEKWEFTLPQEDKLHATVPEKYTVGSARTYEAAKRSLKAVLRAGVTIQSERLPAYTEFDAEKVEVPKQWMHVEQVLNTFQKDKKRWRRILDTTILAAAGASVGVATVAVSPLAAVVGVGYIAAIGTGALVGFASSAAKAGLEIRRARTLAAENDVRIHGQLRFLGRSVAVGAVVGTLAGGTVQHLKETGAFDFALQKASEYVLAMWGGGDIPSGAPGPGATLPDLSSAPMPTGTPVAEAAIVPDIKTVQIPPPSTKLSDMATSFSVAEVRHVPGALEKLFASANFGKDVASNDVIKWLTQTITDRTYHGYGGTRGTDVLEMLTGRKGLTPKTIPDSAGIDFTRYFQSPLAVADLEARIGRGMLDPQGSAARNEELRAIARHMIESITEVIKRR